MRSFLYQIPTILITALLLPACGGTAVQTEQVPTSVNAPEELSSWSRVIEADFDGKAVNRKICGFVEHRRVIDHKEGKYFVYGIKNLKEPVGFYLPSGQTYRYRIADDGTSTSRNIGIHRPVASVRLLLDIEAEIEFDQQISK